MAKYDRKLNETPDPPDRERPSRVPVPPGMSKQGILSSTSGIGSGATATGDWSRFLNKGTPAAPAGSGGGGGGGGMGGGGGFGAMPNWGGAGDPGNSQSDFLWGVMKGIVSGEDVPFGPEEIEAEKVQAKTASENSYDQAKEEIQSQQAATGFASSPAALRPLVGARIAASQQYGRASNTIMQNAAQQNFNARLTALNSAQDWLNSLRSYVATMTGSWWQREQAAAQLKLAEATLAEQKRQFNLDFAARNA